MDVDAEVRKLYGLAPEGFVAERDALAKRLRAAGERDAAGRVKALRRPTVAAWAVNQAARAEPDLAAELLAAGGRLRQAQRRALSGLRDSGLQEAGAERRAAIDRLTAAATRALEAAGRTPDTHRDAIAATLLAASTSEQAAEELRSGTVARELTPDSGFGDVEGLTLVPTPPRPPRPADRKIAAARRARDQARRRANEATTTARTAQQAAQQAEQAARTTAETATRHERTAAQAAREAESARTTANHAATEATTARTRAEAATSAAGEALTALEQAEQALESLEGTD